MCEQEREGGEREGGGGERERERERERTNKAKLFTSPALYATASMADRLENDRQGIVSSRYPRRTASHQAVTSLHCICVLCEEEEGGGGGEGGGEQEEEEE